jgi:hypothetical protein
LTPNIAPLPGFSPDPNLLPPPLPSHSREAASFNQALQRTAPAVMARASASTFPPAMHGPRQPRLSLSLGSLGASALALKSAEGILRT